ncbi:MAG: hypothetical protein ACHQET_12865 [Chitinophagales bacterium]
MRKLLATMLVLLLNISCKHQKNLSEQLTESFVKHLGKIDSLAKLDSVHILWNTSATQKLGAIIDDSAFTREFMRVQLQLRSAQQKNEKDSIEFYQYELSYMKGEIDSVNKSISLADTSHKYGYLIGCAYYITKNKKTIIDSTLIFIDSTSTLRYTEFMDSAIKRSIKMFN